MTEKAAPATVPALVTDAELAPMLRVSVSFLRRDRVTRQCIPFVRIGDRCLYDPQAVLETVKAGTVGGRQARGRRVGALNPTGGR